MTDHPLPNPDEKPEVHMFFDHVYEAADVNEAFTHIVEYGRICHNIWGVTINARNKTEFFILQENPVSETESYELANDLLENPDPRMSHTDGPLGAFPFISKPTEENTGKESRGWVFVGAALGIEI